MRSNLMVHLLIIGVLLQALSYLLLATPWGFPPDSVSHSDPRVPFAPIIFIAGMALIFLGVITYELTPRKRDE